MVLEAWHRRETQEARGSIFRCNWRLERKLSALEGGNLCLGAHFSSSCDWTENRAVPVQK